MREMAFWTFILLILMIVDNYIIYPLVDYFEERYKKK